MSKKNKDVIVAATNKLSEDIKELTSKKQGALQVFVNTASQLQSVNAQLDDKITQCDEIMSLVASVKTDAETMKADNDVICEKIRAIIGE
jgi:ABC-type transporter Mla subunit MlaD